MADLQTKTGNPVVYYGESLPISSVINVNDVRAIFLIKDGISAASFDPTVPDALNDLKSFEPGNGYHIIAAKSFSLTNAAPPLPGATPTPTPTPVTAQYDFESGVQGWGNNWNSPYLVEVISSSDKATTGTKSLRTTINNTSATEEYVTVLVADPGITAGNKIKFRYFVDSSSIQAVQPFAQGSVNNWMSQWIEPPVVGSWQVSEVDIPSDAGTIHSLGIQVRVAANSSAKLYIDSVSWALAIPSPTPAPTPTPSPTPSPTPTPAPSPSGYFTKAALGMGLNGISDWSTQMPFLNVFKHARPFEGATVDADGYVTTGSGSTYIFADNPMSGGRWVVKWDGQGSFAWAGATVVSSAANRQVISINPDTGVELTVTSGSASNYPKNIRVVLESREPLLDSGAMFNPDFISKLRESKSKVLRFMDWMCTNWSAQGKWSDRPLPSNAVWSGWAGKGVPIEVMCALCNELNVHPWFCIPHLADDDYVRQFANIVKANLKLELMPHVEYSNEVWNWMFGQFTWCFNQGKARWGDIGDAHMQWAGMRCAQITKTWKEILGSSRVKGVLATQTVWLGLEDGLLNAPKWVAEGNVAPHKTCDLYAITTYFDCGIVDKDNYATVASWASQGATGIDKAFEQILLNKYFPSSGGVDKYIPEFKYHKSVGDLYGLSLVAYEGGQHLLDFTGNGDTLTNFLTALSRDSRMGTVYARNQENWKQAGGTVACQFVDIATPTKYGCWGALERVDQDTSPKWKTLIDWSAVNQGV